MDNQISTARGFMNENSLDGVRAETCSNYTYFRITNPLNLSFPIFRQEKTQSIFFSTEFLPISLAFFPTLSLSLSLFSTQIKDNSFVLSFASFVNGARKTDPLSLVEITDSVVYSSACQEPPSTIASRFQ